MKPDGKVKLIYIPLNLQDYEDLQTLTLFEKC